MAKRCGFCFGDSCCTLLQEQFHFLITAACVTCQATAGQHCWVGVNTALTQNEHRQKRLTAPETPTAEHNLSLEKPKPDDRKREKQRAKILNILSRLLASDWTFFTDPSQHPQYKPPPTSSQSSETREHRNTSQRSLTDRMSSLNPLRSITKSFDQKHFRLVRVQPDQSESFEEKGAGTRGREVQELSACSKDTPWLWDATLNLACQVR